MMRLDELRAQATDAIPQPETPPFEVRESDFVEAGVVTVSDPNPRPYFLLPPSAALPLVVWAHRDDAAQADIYAMGALAVQAYARRRIEEVAGAMLGFQT